MEYNLAADSFSTFSGAEASITSDGITVTPTRSTEFNTATNFVEEGDILSTAQSPTASPVVGRPLYGNDTIEVHGLRMTLDMAQQMGFVQKDHLGQYSATKDGTAGAKHQKEGPTQTKLASGGTAEEAAEGNFRGTIEAEQALTSIVGSVSQGAQLSVLDSFLNNGGEVSEGALSDMASQMGLEPEQAAALVEKVYAGMEKSAMTLMEKHGVYSPEAFDYFVHSSPEVQKQLIDSARDLMMHNSTAGLKDLAAQFAQRADMADPGNVDLALHDAGIPFRRTSEGVILDLSAQGIGEVSFQQAVRTGIIKLSRNNRL